jgi:hypothetical protein
MGDQISVEPIRLLLGSIEKADPTQLKYLLEACYLLRIPEGKSWAYKAIDSYCNYKSKMGIGDVENAFKFAVSILVTQPDTNTLDRLEKLIGTFVMRLKVAGASGLFGETDDVASSGLATTVESLAASEYPRAIELTVDFVKDATTLSSRGNQSRSTQYVVQSVLSIRSTARKAINIWQQSGNIHAVALLNNNLGEEQVKAFLQSKD